MNVYVFNGGKKKRWGKRKKYQRASFFIYFVERSDERALVSYVQSGIDVRLSCYFFMTMKFFFFSFFFFFFWDFLSSGIFFFFIFLFFFHRKLLLWNIILSHWLDACYWSTATSWEIWLEFILKMECLWKFSLYSNL